MLASKERVLLCEFCILYSGKKNECHELLKYGSFVAKYLKLVGVEIVVTQRLIPRFLKKIMHNTLFCSLLPQACIYNIITMLVSHKWCKISFNFGMINLNLQSYCFQ